MNTTLANNVLSSIDKQNINVELINKETLEGKIKVEEDGYLLLTIPYEKGLKVYIDDVQIDIEKAYDYFTAASIVKGEHIIKIVYNKKIHYISVLISALFIFMTIFFVKKCKKTHKNKKNF